MVDLYCERVAAGLWGEPLNTLTNLAFFVTAAAIWRLGHRPETGRTGLWFLVILSVAIGVGSTLFHTLATSWARVLDVIPILLFQIVFIWLYCSRILGIRSRRVGWLLVAYLGAILFTTTLPDVSNGTLTYIPAVLAVLVLGVSHYRRRLIARTLLLTAAGVFVAALLFRFIDGPICVLVPTGTHFLWHVLTAILLYLVSRAYLVNLSSVHRPA